MENQAPQPESKFVLVTLGILFACICVALAGIGAFTALNLEEIERGLGSELAPSAKQAFETQEAYRPTAEFREDWVEVSKSVFERVTDSIGWSFGTHKNELGQLSFHLQNGWYEWEIETFRDMTWREPDSESTGDYDVSVFAASDQVFPELHYGLMFGYQDGENFYIFQVTADGIPYFSVIEEGEWTDLATWRTPNAFRPGSVNKLQVIHEASNYTFLVNDEYLGEFRDDRFPRGYVGLAAGVDRAGGPYLVRFDDFLIRMPHKLVTPTKTRRPTNEPVANSTRQPTQTLVQVPKVVGFSPAEAVTMLHSSGLQVETILQPSEPCAALVFRQEPRASSYVSKNARIKIYSCK